MVARDSNSSYTQLAENPQVSMKKHQSHSELRFQWFPESIWWQWNNVRLQLSLCDAGLLLLFAFGGKLTFVDCVLLYELYDRDKCPVNSLIQHHCPLMLLLIAFWHKVSLGLFHPSDTNISKLNQR